MRHLLISLMAVTVLQLPIANAADFGFTGITKSEFQDIIEDFGSNFTHKSVSGASSLGKLFGFEVGLIAGATKSESIDKLAKEFDANAEDIDSLPHAALFGAVTFPFGITGEINFIPEIKNSDIEFKTGSLAVKWTPTDIWELPVELAVKFHAASSEVKWNQDVGGNPASLKYEQDVTGLLLQVSKKFLVLEPYFNIGSIKAEGEMGSSQGSVFDAGYTTASKSKEDVSGTMTHVGLNANLMFFKLGAEVGKVLGNGQANLKASFYF